MGSGVGGSKECVVGELQDDALEQYGIVRSFWSKMAAVHLPRGSGGSQPFMRLRLPSLPARLPSARRWLSVPMAFASLYLVHCGSWVSSEHYSKLAISTCRIPSTQSGDMLILQNRTVDRLSYTIYLEQHIQMQLNVEFTKSHKG